MLKRLRYVSEFAKAMSSVEIDELVKTSAKKNQDSGVTGVLVATGELFFQIIEGPPAAVDAIWQAIQGDARHREVLLLEMEQGDLTRLFPNWAMKKGDLTSQSATRLQPLRAILKAVHKQTSITRSLMTTLEQAMWHEIQEVETKDVTT